MHVIISVLWLLIHVYNNRYAPNYYDDCKNNMPFLRINYIIFILLVGAMFPTFHCRVKNTCKMISCLRPLNTT